MPGFTRTHQYDPRGSNIQIRQDSLPGPARIHTWYPHPQGSNAGNHQDQRENDYPQNPLGFITWSYQDPGTGSTRILNWIQYLNLPGSSNRIFLEPSGFTIWIEHMNDPPGSTARICHEPLLGSLQYAQLGSTGIKHLDQPSESITLIHQDPAFGSTKIHNQDTPLGSSRIYHWNPPVPTTRIPH